MKRAARLVSLTVVALVVSGVACGRGDVVVSGGAGVGEAVRERVVVQERAVPESGLVPPVDVGDGERAIASGEAGGVGWRLFVLPAGAGKFVCLESEASRAGFACSGGFGSERSPSGMTPVALGVPGLAEGNPTFLFGTLNGRVARVTVELEVREPLVAEIVGEERAHYVAALPEGASPTEVVAYGAGGEELARKGFLDDEPAADWRMEEWESQCAPTEDGYECRGGATIEGYGSVSGGVTEK